MTQLLEKAIERLKAVPEQEQDAMARWLLSELEEDERWAATTDKYKDGVARMMKRVIADDEAGLCEPLDPDTL